MGEVDKQRHLRVLMVVGGFPTRERPDRSLVNLQVAQELAGAVDIRVIFLRIWCPGRRIVSESYVEGIPVVAQSLPQIPHGFGSRWRVGLNLASGRILGWRLARRLLESCDLVHSVAAMPVGVLSSTWAQKAHVHHVTHLIGSDVNSALPEALAFGSIRGWDAHLHGVAGHSKALTQAFLKLYPQASNARTVYWGVDLEHFVPSKSAANHCASQRGARFLFLGGFPSYPGLRYGRNTKGGETLLAAWESAETHLIAADASLVIAGPYTNTDHELPHWRAGLRQPRRVHIAGPLPPAQIPSCLQGADVLLLPSMEEGLPKVAMEASACGRPVFGSDVGGVPEVVVHGETGLLLPPGDVAAWQDVLVTYAERVDALRQMGARARQRMEGHFDRRNFAPLMLDLYQAALREPLG